MNFKEWVLHFKDVDRPIGDLASDISKDPNFPNENVKEKIQEYLAMNADILLTSKILETFNNAWDFYLNDTLP